MPAPGLPGKFCDRGSATVEFLGARLWPTGAKDYLGRDCRQGLGCPDSKANSSSHNCVMYVPDLISE